MSLVAPYILFPAAGGGTFAVTAILDGTSPYSDNVNTSTPSWDIDISAYGSGDIVVAVIGPDHHVTNGTLNGDTQTPATTIGSLTGGRLAVVTWTLSGTGSATETVSFTCASSSNDWLCYFFVIEGGAIQDTAGDAVATGGVMSADVTPTAANNTIISVAFGKEDASWDTDYAWTGPTEQAGSATPVIRGATGSYARADDVTASALYSVDFNPGTTTSDDSVICSLAIQEV